MEKEFENLPIIDIKGKKIHQIGFVVRDAAKTAKRYSEIFGLGPWLFLDVHSTENILHDKPLGEVELCFRIALTDLGEHQIELVQPLYGPGTHMEFLHERGEGIHHISFGRLDDHDRIVTALQDHGVAIEMQGLTEYGSRFTYMATQGDLGTIFELAKPPAPEMQDARNPWGTYPSPEKSLLHMEGKQIIKIGIVVQDVEKTVKRYWEIFGIGPWTLIDLKPPHLSDLVFHGIPMNDGNSFLKIALARHENIQFELLEPVYGPSTHMDFLKTHGEGINYLSFGRVDDHDEIVSVLEKQGIDIEFTGVLGGATRFTYMASQEELGAIFEIRKTYPGVTSTLLPHGAYPASK